MTRRTFALLLALAALPATASADGGRTAVAVDPKEPKRVVVWQEGRGLFASRDGGETWERLAASPRLVVRIVVGRGQVHVASSEGLLRSEDDGRTFVRAGGPPGESPNIDLAAAGDALFSVTENGVFRSTDGARTFRSAGVSGRAFHAYRLRTNPRQPAQVLLVSPTLVHRSDDGGESWKRVPAPPDLDFGSLSFGVGEPPVSLVAGRSGISRSTDGGATWKGVPDAPPFLRGLWVPDPASEKYLLVTMQPQPGDEKQTMKILEKALLRTLDGGKSWSGNLSPDGGGVTEVAFAPGRTETIYAATDLGGVFRSANMGESWRAVTPPAK